MGGRSVQLDVPRVESRDLFGSQMAARSDWFDAACRQTRENPVALKLFDRLWAVWRKRFTFPVLARNVKDGGEGLQKSIGYSPGAAAWVGQGGSLRQDGVANIVFGIPESKASGPRSKTN